MGKYRVRAGSHVENGQTYKRGEIVDSPLALDRIFKEKFDVVGTDPAPEVKATTPTAKHPKQRSQKAAVEDEADGWKKE